MPFFCVLKPLYCKIPCFFHKSKKRKEKSLDDSQPSEKILQLSLHNKNRVFILNFAGLISDFLRGCASFWKCCSGGSEFYFR